MSNHPAIPKAYNKLALIYDTIAKYDQALKYY